MCLKILILILKNLILRVENDSNPVVTYLNINSLGEKINHLRHRLTFFELMKQITRRLLKFEVKNHRILMVIEELKEKPEKVSETMCVEMIVRLIEESNQKLDKGFLAGTVLTDLSRVFDCIPHNLLIAKLNVYGFDRKFLVFYYSYLKRR